MSVGIVCMLNNTALHDLHVLHAQSHSSNESHNEVEECYFKELKHAKKLDGPFFWDKGLILSLNRNYLQSFSIFFIYLKDIQGLILSAYFYGYIFLEVTQLLKKLFYN